MLCNFYVEIAPKNVIYCIFKCKNDISNVFAKKKDNIFLKQSNIK